MYKFHDPFRTRIGMSPNQTLSPIDFHVLLVLGQGALYGYAIKQALERDTDGALDPEIGSLYRVLARLVNVGFVEQVDGTDADAGEVHPGRQRKYYALTPAGERAFREEATRLRGALELARGRGLMPGGGS